MIKKTWWRSKTLWFNLVAGIALLAQTQFGFVVPPEVQMAALTLVNIALRLITKEAVGFQDADASGTGVPACGSPGPFPGIDAGPPEVTGK